MRQRGLCWILKGFSHKEASCFYFATHSAFSSPLSGALGLPRPLSAPTQQVPQAGNWVQEWGQLGCHMMAKPAEGSPRWTGGLPQAVGCACARAYACSAGRSLGVPESLRPTQGTQVPRGRAVNWEINTKADRKRPKKKGNFFCFNTFHGPVCNRTLYFHFVLGHLKLWRGPAGKLRFQG